MLPFFDEEDGWFDQFAPLESLKCWKYVSRHYTELNMNKTLGVTVRLGSCSPGNEPDLCSVLPMFGTVQFGKPTLVISRPANEPRPRLSALLHPETETRQAANTPR